MEAPALPRWAFRVGYLADGFRGYARQPGLPTVEGLLREGLASRGILTEPTGRFQTASRTDRGVHALGNVIAFSTRLAGPAVARTLNTLDPRVFCWGFAPVPPGFCPRSARGRWYRYFEPEARTALESYRQGAALFVGDHDFSSFGRRDDPPREARRVLQELTVNPRGEFLILDFRAPSFLWGQVRKTVSALRQFADGRLSSRALQEALRGDRRLSLPLAEAEGLVLLEVDLGVPFRSLDRPPVLPLRFWEEASRSARLRSTLLGEFRERVLPGRSDP
ncbi:tRNA pseudouridine synthase [mine drainage metagenome]|uniref:tRNA pseudouridine synthase n=1 Tax=mine drainage metagenome TaxID=410659 RepID=T0Z8F2_9ZZZZ